MARSTDTKQKLMDAATELIWKSNYAAIGVAEICKTAGVTKGSFYHYFESKADLFYEASMHHWEEFRHRLDTLFSPSTPPLEQLEGLIDMIVAKQLENAEKSGNPVSGCPVFLSGGQAGCGEDKIRLAALELSERVVQYNISMIRGLQAENMLAGDMDARQLGRILHQYIMGLLLYGRIQHSLEAVTQDLRDAVYRIVGLHEQYWQTDKPIADQKLLVDA